MVNSRQAHAAALRLHGEHQAGPPPCRELDLTDWSFTTVVMVALLSTWSTSLKGGASARAAAVLAAVVKEAFMSMPTDLQFFYVSEPASVKHCLPPGMDEIGKEIMISNGFVMVSELMEAVSGRGTQILLQSAPQFSR
eukprot:10034514-Lingulodinium_polyedra.AAC.1